MAKKDRLDVSSSIDDFGDFDFNAMDESGFKADQVATPSKMRSDYIPAMRSGFLSGLKQEIDSKMPYTAAVADQVMGIFNEAKNMTTQFAEEAAPLVRSIGRSTNRLMPIVRPFMPKGAYDAITGKLSAIPDEEQGEMSEEQRNAQQITADINAAFQGSDAQAQVRENMGQVVAGMRHKATMGAISGLANQMIATNKFLSSSLMAYMKKDLELQYRQLYVQKDISSTLRATAKLLDAELKNITHNTGLPEQVKAKSFEKRKTARMKFRDYLGNYASNFMKNIKANILDQIKEGLTMVADASSMGADAAEMMEEMGEKVTLGNLFKKGAFHLAGKWFGGKAGKAIARTALPFLNGGWESGMKNLGHSVVNAIEDYTNSHDGFFSQFLQMGQPEAYSKQLELRNDLEKDPTKTVQFDISTREAIVTIIPGYLAKIHKVVADIQNPEVQHDELSFDTKTLSLTSKSEIRGAAVKHLDKIIKPDAWGSQDHLSVIAVGQALRGRKADDIDAWLKTANQDGSTNRENITRLFINMSRTPGIRFRPEYLKAVLDNPREATIEQKRYWRMVMNGVFNRAQVATYLVEAVSNPDGSWNLELVNQYENTLVDFGSQVDINIQADQIEDTLLNGPSALKSELMEYAQSIGLIKDNKVDEDILNGLMARAMASESLRNKVGTWTNERNLANAIAAQNSPGFNIRLGVRNLFEWMGGKVDPSADKTMQYVRGMAEDLKKVFTDNAEALVAGGTSLAREIVGDNTMDAFNATVDALAGRYIADKGPEMFALDLIMVSSDTTDEDKAVINNFIEAAKEAKDAEEMDKLKVGTEATIKDDGVRQVFHEAVVNIRTRKDAVYMFGDVKERLKTLNSESVVVELKKRCKDRLDKFKDRSISIKQSITDTIKRAATGFKQGAGIETPNVGATPASSAKPSNKELKAMVNEYVNTHKGVSRRKAREIILKDIEAKNAQATETIDAEEATSTTPKTSLLETGKSAAKNLWSAITGTSSDVVNSFKEALTIPESVTSNIESIADHLKNIHDILRASLGDVKAKEVIFI